jgi:hypothetical protein
MMMLRSGEFHANWLREGDDSLLCEPFSKFLVFDLTPALCRLTCVKVKKKRH